MDTVMIEGKQFEQLMAALQKTSDMLALNLVRDCQKQNEKIVLLSGFGYAPLDISRILNTTAKTVRTARYKAKRGKNNRVKKPETNQTKNSTKEDE